MAVPLDHKDVEYMAMERAEELAQKQTGRSFDDLPSSEQMSLFQRAEQQVREELNEAAERAGELAWECEHIPDDVGDLERVR